MADAQRRRLGKLLREARETAGLTQDQAAEVLERDRTVIPRLERGQRGIRRGELDRLLDAYKVNDHAMRGEMHELARAGAERPWYAAWSSSMSPNYASYVGFESDAREIFAWEPMFVPGLLQTEDYAREVIRGTEREISADEVERRVQIRVRRQAQVAKTCPRLWVVMDEAALLRPVGGADVMVRQLRHLVDRVKEPQVTVQVVPLDVGAHPGMMGAISILKFAPPIDDVIYLETGAGDLYPVGAVAEARRNAYEHLRACALDSNASMRRIIEAMKDMEGRSGSS